MVIKADEMTPAGGAAAEQPSQSAGKDPPREPAGGRWNRGGRRKIRGVDPRREPCPVSPSLPSVGAIPRFAPAPDPHPVSPPPWRGSYPGINSLGVVYVGGGMSCGGLFCHSPTRHGRCIPGEFLNQVGNHYSLPSFKEGLPERKPLG